MAKTGQQPIRAYGMEKLNVTRFHLHASACYCSIFNECKVTEFGESRPKPVASCDAAPSENTSR